MNWSKITCAPLAKSPNCASQITSDRGSTSEYPYSKPTHAHSVSGELKISKRPFAPLRWRSAHHSSPVSWSKTAAWRWLKVPRFTSCPVMRTTSPSSTSEA